MGATMTSGNVWLACTRARGGRRLCREGRIRSDASWGILAQNSLPNPFHTPKRGKLGATMTQDGF